MDLDLHHDNCYVHKLLQKEAKYSFNILITSYRHKTSLIFETLTITLSYGRTSQIDCKSHVNYHFKNCSLLSLLHATLITRQIYPS